MTNFNIQRFGRTLLWSAKMTQKEIITLTAAMFFALSVPFVVAVLSGRHASVWAAAAGFMSAVQVDVAIYIVISVIGGCWIFNNMKTKEQRITFKMLPATDLEKFAARALYVTLVWWLMGLVAYCAADVFRMLLCLIIGTDPVKCFIPDFFTYVFGVDNHTVHLNSDDEPAALFALYALACTWSFWVHSLYILGGALFRRRQFVLTTLAHFILMLVFTPVIINFIDTVDTALARQWVDTWAWSLAAVFAAAGVLDWWLSYKIFRRMQVINNKWVNL